jgi:hypothetical protein
MDRLGVDELWAKCLWVFSNLWSAIHVKIIITNWHLCLLNPLKHEAYINIIPPRKHKSSLLQRSVGWCCSGKIIIYYENNTHCRKKAELLYIEVGGMTTGKLLGPWATVTGGSRWKSWPHLAENIYLWFQFWIAVQVVPFSPKSNAFSITSKISINFLQLWRHPHAKFAEYMY